MSQQDLFSQTEQERIDLQGRGSLDYYPGWFADDLAKHYFSYLMKAIPWEQPYVSLYGKSIKIPRKQAWYGDSGAVMMYSGTRFSPLPWLPLLKTLNEKIEKTFNLRFNSVLANLYRSGSDSVSWHADDEPELGINPVIASLSFGASRNFLLKPKTSDIDENKKAPRQLLLNNGDLIIMSGSVQKFWQHAILKEQHIKEPRINLTFRFVHGN